MFAFATKESKPVTAKRSAAATPAAAVADHKGLEQEATQRKGRGCERMTQKQVGSFKEEDKGGRTLLTGRGTQGQ